MLFQHRTYLHLDSIDSTNNYAANLQKLTPLPEGSVITAQYQVQGRGQRGNLWESEYGQNLLFSVVLYPRFIAASSPFLLSEVVSVALRSALEEVMGREVWIKWPNDIICGDKKLAGILIEMNWIGSQVHSAIAGIGINLNQMVFNLPGATSVKHITGQQTDRDAILESFLTELERIYMKAMSGGAVEIHQMYHHHLFGRGIERSFRDIAGDETFTATIERVDEEGMLRLRTLEGQIRRFGVKELSFLW